VHLLASGDQSDQTRDESITDTGLGYGVQVLQAGSCQSWAHSFTSAS
jgi:hypothetical protein